MKFGYSFLFLSALVASTAHADCDVAGVRAACGDVQVALLGVETDLDFAFDAMALAGVDIDSICVGGIILTTCITTALATADVPQEYIDDVEQCMLDGPCPPPSFFCFAEDSTVQIAGQESPVAMKDLKIGDSVLAANNQYQSVYGFAHKIPDALDKEYVEIKTAKDEQPLYISQNHLIFLAGEAAPVPAGSLRVGDVLVDSDNQQVTVDDVHIVLKKGVYAPLTADGTIVVNGVKASNYVTLNDHGKKFLDITNAMSLSHHTVSHLFMAPLRLMCMGVSGKFCEYSTQEEGLNLWSYYGRSLAQWIEQQDNVLFRVALMSTIMTFLASAVAVESVIGASYGPLLLLGAFVLASRARGMLSQKNKKKIA